MQWRLGREWLARCAAALLAAVALGAAAQTAPAPLHFTEAERAWLAQHPVLRVFTKVEWTPIDLYTYEGQFRGLSGDYLALVAQRLGIRFNYQPVPTLAESLEALQRGEAEILPSVSRTPEREKFMDFSQPYLEVPNVYVARRGVPEVGEGRPMAGLRVAVERGYAVGALVRQRHPQAQVVEFADSAAALRGVSEDQADVYLGALPTTTFLVEKLLLTNLEVRGPWHSGLSELHFGVRKGEAMLVRLLDKALANITLAERQEIHRRWTPLHALLAEPTPPLALNADEQRLVATLPPLRVGYEVDYQPYTLRTDDGQLAGMARDYLSLVSEKTGLRVGHGEGGRWSEVLERARRGEVDLLIAVAVNEERRRDFLFVGPWISTPNVLVTRRDAVPVIGLAQYAGRRIAVLRDGQTAYLMRKLHPTIRLVLVDDRQQLLAAVTNGQADAALVNATFVAPVLAQGLGGVLKMAAFFPELNSDLYFAVRRDQPELAALLQRALDSASEAERAAIVSRWAVLPESDAGAEARATLRRLLPLFALALLALGLSLVWGLRLRRAVARRRRNERALRTERDQAEALARVRHDFLAEASHEIRTPVNAVVGTLDRLVQQPLAPTARELAALARRAAQTLSEYVNNLLDLSKSDAGELKLVLQADSLPATLRAAVQAIEPLAQERGSAVQVEIDPALAARHRFDAFRLRQVVLNLLSNAVKFGAGRPVRLQARLLGTEGAVQRLSLCVFDQGVGIAAERLPQLFRPYLQADDSVAHRAGGTGLGLALCKRLVDAMGGQIRVESEKGAGTRITVELALAVDHEPTMPAADAGAEAAPLRVLLADDDRVQQILIEALLQQAGCIVDVADDGEAAQALWRQHAHRLVLTDLQMPGTDGPAFARWLRAQPGGGEVQLVGTSADLYEGERALEAGIARVLPKPVSQALVDEVVQQALRHTAAPARVAAV